MTTTTTTTTRRLESLLGVPSPDRARRAAQTSLTLSVSSSTPSSSSPPQQLGQLLSSLLETELINQDRLSRQVEESREKKDELLIKTRQQTKTIHSNLNKLKRDNLELRKGAQQIKNSLTRDLDQEDEEEEGQEDDTLREKLIKLSTKRKQLQSAKQWFGIIVQAEQIGLTVLRSLESNSLPQAFRSYVGLVDFIKTVYSETEHLKQGGTGTGNGMVGLTSHLVGIANSVWNSLVKVLSTRLLNKLESLGWPTPFQEPLDPFEDSKVAEFQTAFVDLLTLELLQNNNVLPGSSTTTKKSKPLLAMVPLVHPLILRFKWQFSSNRSTNRLDKPEYPLSHVLNLLTAHERFLSEDVQYLLSTNGFDHLDALNEFTSLLLPLLSTRLRQHLPQLVGGGGAGGGGLPITVLAHTVYQVVEFDQVLRSRGYRPRRVGTSLQEFEEQEQQEQEEWEGLSQVILGRKEWFEKWLQGEREFFDTKYFQAIGSSEAWQILSREDYDVSLSPSGTRPTHSALRVKELSEQLSQRYKPLPLKHTLPFLLLLHLPMLQSYAQRITSSLDAFENLSLGSILPGALMVGVQTNAATQGVGGVSRLVRAGVSARWMSEKCEEWGEEAFYLHLYEYLQTSISQDNDKLSDTDTDSEYYRELVEEVLDNSDGTLFDREKKNFQDLADRSEELIVRHCTREVLNELKPYLTKRFDKSSDSYSEEGPLDASEAEELSLSPELVKPLSLLSSLLSVLVNSYPPTTLQSIYRRISQSLSKLLFERLYLSQPRWTEQSSKQLKYDLEQGFLMAGKEAGVGNRGLKRGWEIGLGGAKLLGLPSKKKEENDYDPKNQWIFSKVMKVTWDYNDDDDDDNGNDRNGEEIEREGGEFGKMMEDLGIGEQVFTKSQVKSLLRKRPECWR
ncbi:hypothetical protein JCM5350_002133 [Sporobolomyces pararoseus]